MHKNVACDSKVSGFDAREELRVASCNTVNDGLMQSLASFGHLELVSTPLVTLILSFLTGISLVSRSFLRTSD